MSKTQSRTVLWKDLTQFTIRQSPLVIKSKHKIWNMQEIKQSVCSYLCVMVHKRMEQNHFGTEEASSNTI